MVVDRGPMDYEVSKVHGFVSEFAVLLTHQLTKLETRCRWIPRERFDQRGRYGQNSSSWIEMIMMMTKWTAYSRTGINNIMT